MSRENRLAANVFASLLPWIDEDHDIIFLQDEGGQNDNAMPDFCCQLQGSQNGQIRIEFKVVKATGHGGSLKLTYKQINDWCTSSAYPNKPHCWIGVNEEGTQYYFWDHELIAPLIEVVQPATGYRTVHIPQGAVIHDHFLAIFRALLHFAAQLKLCP